MYCIIIYLSFLNCDWLLTREVKWFYLTEKLLVKIEKIKVRMPKVMIELSTAGLQPQCSSHWAIQLKIYCWEGRKFIELVYCIIIYLSFLSCDYKPWLQTQCSSHWVIRLKNYCWEGVEFIQLVYCISTYFSFLNCDWLLIWEVQSSY